TVTIQLTSPVQQINWDQDGCPRTPKDGAKIELVKSDGSVVADGDTNASGTVVIRMTAAEVSAGETYLR
ncbi:MAG: hypothetical protein AB1546_05550, partial [bacterium]